MSDPSHIPSEKKFLIKAVIRYHMDIGEFMAASDEAAIDLAMQSDRYRVVSDRSPGGVYDLIAEEIV